MKACVLTDGFSSLPDIEGAKVERLWATKDSKTGRTSFSKSVLDFDVFLVNLSMVSEDEQNALREGRLEIQQMVQAGASFITFVEMHRKILGNSNTDLLSGIPFSPKDRWSLVEVSSEKVFYAMPDFADVNHGLFRDVYGKIPRKVLAEMSPLLSSTAYFDKPWHGFDKGTLMYTTPVYSNPARQPVGYLMLHAHSGGSVFVLPKPRDSNKIVVSLLEKFLREYSPWRFKSRGGEEAPPEWVEAEVLRFPGSTEVLGAVNELQESKQDIESKISEEQLKYQEFEKWAGLLFQTDTPLEEISIQALELLLDVKAPCTHEPMGNSGPDISFDTDQYQFIVECSGSVKILSKKKGNQLGGWLDEEVYSENHKGFVIGNPFRLMPLAERRTKFAGDPDSVFSPQLLRAAKNRNYGIVWSVDLYDLVVKKLSGGSVSSKDIVEAILKHGLISF